LIKAEDGASIVTRHGRHSAAVKGHQAIRCPKDEEHGRWV
jgi:hypothetical protein